MKHLNLKKQEKMEMKKFLSFSPYTRPACSLKERGVVFVLFKKNTPFFLIYLRFSPDKFLIASIFTYYFSLSFLCVCLQCISGFPHLTQILFLNS
jgi:hypothetical protein